MPGRQPIRVHARWTLSLLMAAAVELAASPPAERWYRQPAASWSSLEDLNRPVQGPGLDTEFLAAAVFHESNRVRLQHGQLRLLDDRRARTAAALQAATIAATGLVVHASPLPGESTPRARLQASGLRPLRVGENVAMTPIRFPPTELRDGTGALGSGSGTTASSAGREGPFRTYREVALAIVQQWLDSPRHRALLLSPQFSGMGCAVRFGRLASGSEVVYTVQVLFDPEDPRN